MLSTEEELTRRGMQALEMKRMIKERMEAAGCGSTTAAVTVFTHACRLSGQHLTKHEKAPLSGESGNTLKLQAKSLPSNSTNKFKNLESKTA